jgi:uncharacterized RmlC-like cupin family protein
MSEARVRRIPPEERSVGDPTFGMIREQAIATDVMWSGFLRTAPGAVSGWHHHGGNETVIYLSRGAMRIESGMDGNEVVDLGPGDFCYIPRGRVHREGNPGSEESHAIVTRAGTGPPTINVNGPEGSRHE